MFSKAPPEFLKRTLTGSRGGDPRAATAWTCAGRPLGYHTEFFLLSQRTRRRLDSCRRAGLSLPKRDRSFVGKRKMGRRAHWIDPQTNRRLDYTKIIPEDNIELTGIWQMEFDTEDHATHYQNGILSDLEVLAIKRFKNGLGIGFVESWIQQVNDDAGGPAALNGFLGRAFGIGPIVTYSTKLGKSPLDLSTRWVQDFGVRNTHAGEGFEFRDGL